MLKSVLLPRLNDVYCDAIPPTNTIATGEDACSVALNFSITLLVLDER